MEKTKTLFLLTLLCMTITSAVVIQSSRVETNGRTLDPPQLRLIAGNQSIPGILGTYCRRYKESHDECVEKFPPEQIATRATLVSKMVGPEEKISFEVLDYRQPKMINYRVLDEEGNRILEATQNNGGFTIGREGKFLIVADAYWDSRRITYTYQIKTE